MMWLVCVGEYAGMEEILGLSAEGRKMRRARAKVVIVRTGIGSTLESRRLKKDII